MDQVRKNESRGNRWNIGPRRKDLRRRTRMLNVLARGVQTDSSAFPLLWGLASFIASDYILLCVRCTNVGNPNSEISSVGYGRGVDLTPIVGTSTLKFSILCYNHLQYVIIPPIGSYPLPALVAIVGGFNEGCAVLRY